MKLRHIFCLLAVIVLCLGGLAYRLVSSAYDGWVAGVESYNEEMYYKEADSNPDWKPPEKPVPNTCFVPGHESFRKSKHTLEQGMFQLNLYARPGLIGDKNQFFRDLKKRLSAIQGFYTDVLGAENLRTVKASIHMYPDKKTFEEAIKKEISPNLGGFYDRRNGNIHLLYKNPELGLQTIVHEITHAVNHRLTGYLEAWLNEGTAEVFSQLNEKQPGQFHAGTSRWTTGRGDLRFRPLSLASTLRIKAFPDQNIYTSKKFVYSNGWLFSEFLVTTKLGRTLVKEILHHKLDEPCTPMDEAVFYRIFADSGRDVEAEYALWMYELYGYVYPYLPESRWLSLQTSIR